MRVREPDEACAQAVDLARDAAVAISRPGYVGQHIGVEVDGDRVVTHLFECLDPAYHDWRWAVTLARASRTKAVTVDETVLLPGPGAILAPAWVPWRERLRPGDLGVGDILPAPADDERLVLAVALEGEDGLLEWADVADATTILAESEAEAPAEVEISEPGPAGQPEPGPPERLVPAQARVLSAAGRDDAALRWYTGDQGPSSPLAHAAPAPCVSCGFFVRLNGPLGQVFGACANSYAPDDGQVVSVDHGCGAHSEGLPLPEAGAPAVPVIDEIGYDLVDRPGISVEETDFEPIEGG